MNDESLDRAGPTKSFDDEQPAPQLAFKRSVQAPLEDRLRLHGRKKRSSLVLLFLWSIASGTIYGLSKMRWEQVLTAADVFVATFVVLRWTYHDIRQREAHVWRYFAFMLLVLPLVVLPIYLLRTRGRRGGLQAILIALGILVLHAVAMNVALYVALACIDRL